MRANLLRILVIATVAAVGAAAAAIVVLDREHHLFLRAPHLSYTDHARPETRTILRIEPSRAPDLVAAMLSSSGSTLPPWALSRVTPYEITLLFAPVPSTDTIGVVTFVNEQRLGPGIARAVNAYFASGALPAVQWTAEGMTATQRGLLLANGAMRLNPVIRKAWESTWSARSIQAPLSMNQDHFLELLLDNRDGGAFLVLGTLLMQDVDEQPQGTMDPNVIADTLSDIVSCRVTADRSAPDTLAIQVRFACVDHITEQTKGMFRFFYEMALGTLQQQAQLQGMALEGTSVWKGSNLEGEYTLTNASRLFAGAS